MLNKDKNQHILKVLKEMRKQINDIEDTIMEQEMEVNPIFQDKKAIIGNYDSFGSKELKKILESFGMNVEIFETGSEILEKITEGYRCDVIFTNSTYQRGIQCEELLNKLRQLPNFNTPIIIHTIYTNERIKFVDNIGFDEFIAKPIYSSDNEKILEIKNILKKFLN